MKLTQKIMIMRVTRRANMFWSNPAIPQHTVKPFIWTTNTKIVRWKIRSKNFRKLMSLLRNNHKWWLKKLLIQKINYKNGKTLCLILKERKIRDRIKRLLIQSMIKRMQLKIGNRPQIWDCPRSTWCVVKRIILWDIVFQQYTHYMNRRIFKRD